MRPGARALSTRGMLLGLTAALAPFVSCRGASWLEGTFAALVLLVFLLDVRRVNERCVYRFPMVSVWVPLVVLVLFSLYHLVRSPVPYSSSLFLAHLLLAMVWYSLLLRIGEELSALPVILIWAVVLVPWMLVQKVWMGDPTPSGPYANPNYLATVLLSCLGYATGSLLHRGGETGKRWALLLAGVLSTGGLLMTGSRSAMLGIIILLAILAVLGRNWLRWAAVGVIVISLLVPTTVRYRVTEGYKADAHAFSRLSIWKAALKMGLDHPVLGVGPDLYYDSSPRYAFPAEGLPVKYGRIAKKPHNEYLRSWAEGGAAGVAIAGLFLFLTLGLMAGAWGEGRAGPVLALGMVMFQALFHDVTEVFAPVLLGFWWLSRLTPGGGKPVDIAEGKGRFVPTAAAVLVLAVTVWINLNVISGVLWQNGRKLMGDSISDSSRYLLKALALNPLHSGAARDLARISLDRYTLSGEPEDRELAGEAILRAKSLNRLDSVPLRLEAALYREMALEGGNRVKDLLTRASSSLEEAARLEPYNVLIIMQQAEMSRDLGNSGDALRLVERALELEPNYLEAHRTRIRYLADMDPSLVPGADRQLETAMERTAGYRPVSGYEEIILK